MTSFFLYAILRVLLLFCFAKALHSIPLGGPPGPLSPSGFATIPLHLRKVSSHAGAMVLTLNFPLGPKGRFHRSTLCGAYSSKASLKKAKRLKEF